MIRSLLLLFVAAFWCGGAALDASAQQQPRGGSAPAQSPSRGGGGAPAPSEAKSGAKPAPTAGQQGAPGGSRATKVQAYEDWTVYTTPSGRAKVCYALSQPKSRTPGNLKDVPGYMFVATRPAEKVRNEISLIMNFDLKENADHQAVIGRDQFTLVAKGKNLWVKNPAEERRVIEAMKRANDLVVKGVSARSNATQDRYSMKGFGDALERVQQECR